jgi:glycogen operon protein
MEFQISAGSPEPLGATLDATGVNFAVFSAHATAIEVCLFDAAGALEVARLPLPERSGDIWHGHVAGLQAGARYGLRAHGPYDPRHGQRFNAQKLLLDPYATAIDRPFRLHATMFGYRRGDPAADLSRDDRDSAPYMPKAIIGAAEPDLPPAAALAPWSRTILYELHVRGFTMRHPGIPVPARGTFAGLAAPAMLAHLRKLGVTAVEVMPAAAWVEERHLADLGLTNYWGYNPVGWMVPDPRLAPGGWAEVRAAVAALTAAGFETILDVVLNHSGEGDELGPTLSLRGLDNATYYRLRDGGRYYVDDTGCGDALALDRPPVLRLAMDALRTWVRRAGLHGLRFDLATTLGRRADGFDRAAPLLSAIEQDPALRALKLIAEPWDLGAGGYQAGRFPPAWGEWNDRFRDGVRKFWRGDPGLLGELATRLAGSADLFGPKRRPSRSVNYVVAHDGFTLADLVSYAAKHNEANGEDNRDGTNDNFSWNHGVEGASTDPAVQAARYGDQRALLATLLLARGTPMLAMGAELGHSQAGNNNAYALDNATAWLDWSTEPAGLDAFVARLTALRRDHPALYADRFLTGSADGNAGFPDVAWRTASGQAVAGDAWGAPGGVTLVAVFAADADRVALVLHRGAVPVPVRLPAPRDGFAWEVALDSSADAPPYWLDAADLTCPPRAVLAVAEVPAPGRRPAPAPGESWDAEVDRLALAAGIAPEWWDIDGTRHPVSIETKRALLGAMHLQAGSAAETQASLERLAALHQRRILPYSLAAREGEAPGLAIALDAAEPRRRLNFVIENEDGAQDRLVIPDHAGEEIEIPCADGRPVRQRRVALPVLPTGRWRLWREDRPDLACALTVAPRTCFLPEMLAAGGRRFGLAAHLYALRRAGDQGIGDFTTLARLGAAAARTGAAVVGLNPLHALFPAQRERASPYHPSDRRFLDPIYLDVGGAEGGLDAPEARAAYAAHAGALAALTAAPLVDYPQVWAVKRAVLEAAFAAFDAAGGGDQMAGFQAYGGTALRRFAIFQAIAEQRPESDWRAWPAELRDPDHPGVAAFAAAHADRVRYHAWLQWLADSQLAAAVAASGLAIGLYRDLAIGTAPDGAEAWSEARQLAVGASVGAPPDPFSAAGQIWHLPPPNPWRVREDGFRTLAGILGANMRHAGALRIDHAMGLTRLFWVPDGATGKDGAYVANPLPPLLGELALESRRARCLVVGEDLGTVPEGFRAALTAADVLSYRVLWFERDGAAFRPPAQYPARAVACISTHDLPTLAGWRAGADIAERAALGLLGPARAVRAEQERADEQAALAAALGEPPSAPAVHAFLAASPCALVLAQADDLAGETVALNLPGTDRERPNWRRKIATPVPELLDTAESRAVLGRMRPGRTG